MEKGAVVGADMGRLPVPCSAGASGLVGGWEGEGAFFLTPMPLSHKGRGGAFSLTPMPLSHKGRGGFLSQEYIVRDTV